MANEFTRMGDESNGGGAFVMGLLAGAELRRQLSNRAGSLANTAADGVNRVVDDKTA